MADLRTAALAWKRWQFWRRQYPFLAFRPMEFQRKVMERRVKIRGWIGANRSGKTAAAVMDAVQIALGVKHILYPDGWPETHGPKIVWIIALDANKARDTLVPYVRACLGERIKYRWREADQEFHLPMGSIIAIKSQESGFEKARSAKIHHALFDEQPTEKYFREVMARLIDYNGTCGISLTPDEGITWLYQQIVEPWLEATNGECREANGVLIAGQTMRENRYISKKAVDDFEKTLYDENEKAMRMEGKWLHLKGLVFSNFNVKRHVIDPIPIPKEWRKVRSQDWGCKNPAACDWIAKDPAEGTLHVYRDWAGTDLTVKQIAAEVITRSGDERYEMDLLDPACWNRTGIGAAPGHGDWITLASEYQDAGIPVSKGSRDEPVRIDILKRLLGHGTEKPGILFHRNCVQTIREFRNWQYADNGKPEDARNHNIDATGYGVIYFDGQAGTGGPEWASVRDEYAEVVPEQEPIGHLDGAIEKVVAPDGSFHFKHVLRRQAVGDEWNEDPYP